MREAVRQAHAEEFMPGALGPLGPAAASTRMSASAARSFRAASASASPSPACFSRMRRSWSSTRRPRRCDSEVEAAIQESFSTADGGQDGDRHRPPPLDHRGDGPAGGARPGPDRRDGQPRRADPEGRPLRLALEPPVRRLPRCRRRGGNRPRLRPTSSTRRRRSSPRRLTPRRRPLRAAPPRRRAVARRSAPQRSRSRRVRSSAAPG